MRFDARDKIICAKRKIFFKTDITFLLIGRFEKFENTHVGNFVYAQAFWRTGSYATDDFLAVVNFTTSIFFL